MQTRTIRSAASIALFVVVISSLARGADATTMALDGQINIDYGTAALFSSGGQFLGTKTVLTIGGGSTVGSDWAPFLALLGPDLVSQIAKDPKIPARFKPADLTFDSTGLLTGPFVFGDPEAELNTELTTNPVPAAIIADSGLYPVGDPAGVFYFTGPFGPFPASSNTFYESNVFVNLYERDVQERLPAVVPEPVELPALSLCFAGLLIGSVQRSLHRKCAPVRSCHPESGARSPDLRVTRSWE
jgi:hypothetical protein